MTYGRGSGVVVATGMDTALGRIAELLGRHDADLTPLQRRLGYAGPDARRARHRRRRLVFLTGLARGEDPS